MPRPGRNEPDGTLSGFIAGGDLEGVLHFEAGPEEGIFVRATDALPRAKASLIVGDASHATLVLDEGDARRDFPLERVGDVALDALVQVSVIGHQGLGFGDLGNRERGFEAAWLFGVSGIELDVSVPFEGRRDALRPDQLTVVHPPRNDDTIDLRDAAHFTLASALFPRLGSYGVPFVYVDDKTAGKELDGIREGVLQRLVDLAGQTVEQSPHLHLTIAAVVAEASRFLGGMSPTSPRLPAGCSWALEWVSNEDALEAATSSPIPPAFLTFDMEGVAGTGTWPIDWVLSDVKRDEEARIGRMSQPLLFFTADSNADFEHVLRVHGDAKRFGRAPAEGGLGILTDTPHRLVHWLATPR